MMRVFEIKKFYCDSCSKEITEKLFPVVGKDFCEHCFLEFTEELLKRFKLSEDEIDEIVDGLLPPPPLHGFSLL